MDLEKLNQQVEDHETRIKELEAELQSAGAYIHTLERRIEKILDTLESLKFAYPKNDSFALVHELVQVILTDPKEMDSKLEEFLKKWGLKK